MKRFISIQDAASCMQLIEECGELWSDAAAWQEHLATGFEKLIGGTLAIYLMSQLTREGPSIQEGSLARDTDQAMRKMIAEYQEAGGILLLPELEMIMPVAQRERALAYQQVDLVSRDDYYRSQFWQRFMSADGLENFLSTARLDPTGRVFGFSIHRRRGERRFTERDLAVAELLNFLIAERVGRRLLTKEQSASHSLSTRQRQVLRLLLDGASDKEIASELRISRATAHEHVLAVFRHFEVNSRAKLLSRFIRRDAKRKAAK